jgi:hypothetical protein
MTALNSPEQEPAGQESEDQDPLARFRDWRGFLLAAIGVNVLFVYGMLGNVADPSVRTWFKALVWLPFNAIATAVYLILAVKLSKHFGRVFYLTLCSAMVIANWAVMLGAGH